MAAPTITSRESVVDPAIDMCPAEHQSDRARLRGVIPVAAEVLGHDAFATVRVDDATGIDGTALRDLLHGTVDVDEWIDRVVDGSAHASATGAIGAVVDVDCRVLGPKGCGSSTCRSFRRCPEPTPT